MHSLHACLHEAQLLRGREKWTPQDHIAAGCALDMTMPSLTGHRNVMHLPACDEACSDALRCSLEQASKHFLQAACDRRQTWSLCAASGKACEAGPNLVQQAEVSLCLLGRTLPADRVWSSVFLAADPARRLTHTGSGMQADHLMSMRQHCMSRKTPNGCGLQAVLKRLC